jgi:Icc-related predicted phosphoesterase
MGEIMNEIKVVAISDLHGKFPDISECDLLLIAGDICPCRFGHGYMSVDNKATHQAFWLRDTFGPWLQKQPAKHVVATWGNHDWLGEKAPERTPKLPWHMLIDQGIDLMGFKIYGSPWQPRFFDWAFNADEPFLEGKWHLIPDDTDILVLHGPPHGYGDLAPAYRGVRDQMEHTGSPSLTKRIMEVKPQLVVFGHIHAGYGVYSENGVTMANVAVLNEQYLLTNKPFVTTLKPREK